MNSPTPQVSVLIAAYRAADTLPRAVASALGQRKVSVEVIIVDDASPDDTFAVVKRLADGPCVTGLRLSRNSGPAAARNLALSHARGQWIAVLDADDELTPDRMSHMLDLARQTGADVILGNLMVQTNDGPGPFLSSPTHPVRWSLQDYVKGNLAAANSPTFGYLKPLIRRAFLVRHGIAYDDTLRNGEDFHLILSCLAVGAGVWFSPAPDYIYHRHAASVSHRADPSHMTALAHADRAVATRLADPVARTLMLRRARAIARLASAETALAALREGHPRVAATALLHHPTALVRFTRQLAQALGNRFQP
jgi:succinoglycan biosynthesis protein ExoO